MSEQRISRRELEQMRENLSTRDIEIVGSVSAHRFLTTRQICRLHFADKPTETAALRSANRTLAKLRDMRLLVPLERRIGGVRAGSGAYVWSLGHIGGRLLRRADQEQTSIRLQREYEPSPTFLEHTLAVAEICIRLCEADARGQITLLEVEHEPECWRPYNGSGGATARLKPDLAVVTATDHFEDHWFIEVDLATEPPSRILRACQAYEEYRRSGSEQRRLGLFPAVVWIEPTAKRKQMIETHIVKADVIHHDLFKVITLDELEPLMKAGPEYGTDRPSAAEDRHAS